ncbi:MAG: MerC domain-containing protein [Flavihumibacter sp.]
MKYDHLGIITSIACAIHCTVLPLLVSVLPFLGAKLPELPWLEWLMIGLALCFGIVSLYHGYRRHHHRLLPVVLFAAGFVCLLLNLLSGEAYVFVLIPVAAVMIISAHTYNLYLLRRK